MPPTEGRGPPERSSCMRVAVTQMDISWEDKEKNKIKCEELIKKAVSENADLIVFPEMTLTGFTMNIEIMGEEKTGKPTETEVYFLELSEKYSMAIAFGYILLKDGKAKNMLEIVQNGKTIFEYAKIHPFSYGNENKFYTGGDAISYGELYLENDEKVNIGGFICYDIRFPEVFQISSEKNEMIFVIANWPESRIDHWFTLLKARAVENQCFVVGVNRTGMGNGIKYIPSSVIYDPKGKRLTENSDSEIMFADMNMDMLRKYREEFPVKKDRKKDLYKRLYDRRDI